MRNRIFAILTLMLLCLSVFYFPAYAVENTAPPTVRAWIDDSTLRVVTSDAGSGIEAVYINDSRVNYLVDSALDVASKDYAGTDEYITVYAVDFAGNKSNVVQVKNPYYTAPVSAAHISTTPVSTAPVPTPTASEVPASTQAAVSETSAAPSASSTATAAAVQTPSATQSVSLSVSEVTATATESPVSDETPLEDETPELADENASDESKVSGDESGEDNTEGNPFTPDGTGTVLDDATESDGKEFITIITADENVFYLIIDRERSTDNVYLLNAVTEDDLTSLSKKSDTGSESVIPSAEPVQPNVEPSPEPEPEPETEKSGGNNGTMIFIIIAVIAVGGVGYYFKILKPKRDAGMDDEDDDSEDDYDGEYEIDDESDQELLDEAEYSDEEDDDDYEEDGD